MNNDLHQLNKGFHQKKFTKIISLKRILNKYIKIIYSIT